MVLEVYPLPIGAIEPCSAARTANRGAVLSSWEAERTQRFKAATTQHFTQVEQAASNTPAAVAPDGQKWLKRPVLIACANASRSI
jgi:hypothetical protein